MKTTQAPKGYQINMHPMAASAITAAASLFNFERSEQDRFTNHPLVQLIANLPFLAKTQNPLRDATQNLIAYIAASLKGPVHRIFDHSRIDDAHLLSRLSPIMNFSGGDLGIIRKGMYLLALNLLTGYQRDLDKDRMSGEYNPILSGAWKYQEKVEECLQAITATLSPEIDGILNIKTAAAVWWLW